MPSSAEILKILLQNGWVHVRTSGDHMTLKHHSMAHLITIVHPRKDNPIGYICKIEKLSGIRLRK